MLVSWAAQLRSLKSCWMQWKFEATTAAVKPTSQHPRTKLLTWKILTSSIQQLSSVRGISLYYWHKPVYYWESVAGSVIQATGMVEFEDGLWIGIHLKALEMAHRGLALYLGFNQGWCAHLVSSGGRLNSNLLGSMWLLGVKPGAGFDSKQLGC